MCKISKFVRGSACPQTPRRPAAYRTSSLVRFLTKLNFKISGIFISISWQLCAKKEFRSDLFNGMNFQTIKQLFEYCIQCNANPTKIVVLAIENTLRRDVVVDHVINSFCSVPNASSLIYIYIHSNSWRIPYVRRFTNTWWAKEECPVRNNIVPVLAQSTFRGHFSAEMKVHGSREGV